MEKPRFTFPSDWFQKCGKTSYQINKFLFDLDDKPELMAGTRTILIKINREQILKGHQGLTFLLAKEISEDDWETFLKPNLNQQVSDLTHLAYGDQFSGCDLESAIEAFETVADHRLVVIPIDAREWIYIPGWNDLQTIKILGLTRIRDLKDRKFYELFSAKHHSQPYFIHANLISLEIKLNVERFLEERQISDQILFTRPIGVPSTLWDGIGLSTAASTDAQTVAQEGNDSETQRLAYKLTGSTGGATRSGMVNQAPIRPGQGGAKSDSCEIKSRTDLKEDMREPVATHVTSVAKTDTANQTSQDDAVGRAKVPCSHSVNQANRVQRMDGDSKRVEVKHASFPKVHQANEEQANEDGQSSGNSEKSRIERKASESRIPTKMKISQIPNPLTFVHDVKLFGGVVEKRDEMQIHHKCLALPPVDSKFSPGSLGLWHSASTSDWPPPQNQMSWNEARVTVCVLECKPPTMTSGTLLTKKGGESATLIEEKLALEKMMRTRSREEHPIILGTFEAGEAGNSNANASVPNEQVADAIKYYHQMTQQDFTLADHTLERIVERAQAVTYKPPIPRELLPIPVAQIQSNKPTVAMVTQTVNQLIEAHAQMAKNIAMISEWQVARDQELNRRLNPMRGRDTNMFDWRYEQNSGDEEDDLHKSRPNTPDPSRSGSQTGSAQSEAAQTHESRPGSVASSRTMIPNMANVNTERQSKSVDEDLLNPVFGNFDLFGNPMEVNPSEHATEPSESNEKSGARKFNSASSYMGLAKKQSVTEIRTSDRKKKAPNRFSPDAEFNALLMGGNQLRDLEPFLGDSTQDIEDWFIRYELCFHRIYTGTDATEIAREDANIQNEMKCCLPAKLKAGAYDAWQTLKEDNKKTYELTKTALTEAFKDSFKSVNAKVVLQNMRQGENELVRCFSSRFQLVFNKAFQGIGDDARKMFEVDMFVSKLRIPIKREVKRAFDLITDLKTKKDDFKEVVDIAHLIEMRLKEDEDELDRLDRVKINKLTEQLDQANMNTSQATQSSESDLNAIVNRAVSKVREQIKDANLRRSNSTPQVSFQTQTQQSVGPAVQPAGKSEDGRVLYWMDQSGQFKIYQGHKPIPELFVRAVTNGVEEWLPYTGAILNLPGVQRQPMAEHATDQRLARLEQGLSEVIGMLKGSGANQARQNASQLPRSFSQQNIGQNSYRPPNFQSQANRSSQGTSANATPIPWQRGRPMIFVRNESFRGRGNFQRGGMSWQGPSRANYSATNNEQAQQEDDGIWISEEDYQALKEQEENAQYYEGLENQIQTLTEQFAQFKEQSKQKPPKGKDDFGVCETVQSLDETNPENQEVAQDCQSSNKVTKGAKYVIPARREYEKKE